MKPFSLSMLSDHLRPWSPAAAQSRTLCVHMDARTRMHRSRNRVQTLSQHRRVLPARETLCARLPSQRERERDTHRDAEAVAVKTDHTHTHETGKRSIGARPSLCVGASWASRVADHEKQRQEGGGVGVGSTSRRRHHRRLCRCCLPQLIKGRKEVSWITLDVRTITWIENQRC